VSRLSCLRKGSLPNMQMPRCIGMYLGRLAYQFRSRQTLNASCPTRAVGQKVARTLLVRQCTERSHMRTTSIIRPQRLPTPAFPFARSFVNCSSQVWAQTLSYAHQSFTYAQHQMTDLGFYNSLIASSDSPCSESRRPSSFTTPSGHWSW
jgi:hypothetical protein